MTNYREPQKCYCGTEKCRGFIGGQKNMPMRKKKDKTVERRKVGLFEDEMVSRFFHSDNLYPVESHESGHHYP